MSPQTWTVTVDGKKQTISVDMDARTRRASIRVNGRIVAAPMAADEAEREVPVGSARYTVRRLENDTFDLDIPPEVFLNRATASRSTSKSKDGNWGVGRWIGVVVVALIVVGLLRFGRYGLQYMRVQWRPYAAPDGTFKAKFPEEPKHSTESRNLGGDIWTVNSLIAEYKNHGYAIQYIDLKVVVVDANAESIMDRFFEGWMAGLGARVESKEKTSLARNPAFNFVASVPPGAGPAEEKLKVPARLRGVFALRDRRLFLVWTVAAAADPFSNDLRQFIDGFETSPPPERPAQLIAQPQPEREQEKPRPQPTAAQAQADEKAEARHLQEVAARRAAEPQIYLEREWKMYHVAGCRSVNPSMQQVAIEQMPYGYKPHICVPEEVRRWKWNANEASAAAHP